MSVVANNIVDERLLIEAAQQDPSRFAVLYENNFHRVYAYVARRVPERSEAEDITAEVFHTALANLGRFQWRGVPFASWLLRIAANTMADRWKNRGSAQILSDDACQNIEPGTDAGVERNAMLFQLVERLPADQQLVLQKRFVEQKSLREIAGELGRTEGAVKQLQFRALESLRKEFIAGS